jgi:choline dehydrogenase-like flavoprotein
LRIRDVPGYGAKFKRELREKNVCHVLMNMQGSLFGSPKKYIDLDPDRKDRFGLNLPRIHLHYEQNDVAMAQDMTQVCEEIVRLSGGEIYRSPGTVTTEKLSIDYNHWVGTTKMGSDPTNSVVNVHCQAHEIPNLFIGDASVFAANPEKNPTLTNIALSWRTSEYIVERFRSREV